MNLEELKSSANNVNIEALLKIKKNLEDFKNKYNETNNTEQDSLNAAEDLKNNLEQIIKTTPALKKVISPNIDLCNTWINQLNKKLKK